MKRLGAISLLGFALACSDNHAPPPPAEQAALGGEVAARVGTDVISVALVSKVAAAEHITPREAVARLVDDAICANGARARGLDHERTTSWLHTAALGRITADRLLAEAKRTGPATDAELAELTLRYWREVDRPVTIRVVQAVAQRPPAGAKPDPAAEERARGVAAALKAAVVSAKDTEDFMAKANAVPHPDTEVRVEKLFTAFTAEGDIADGGGNYDPVFAKGAFAIASPGDTSDIIETQFGWHVIRLVERLPEQRMPLEERRIAFADEVVTMRAHVATAARLKAMRSTTPIEISPSAELLMRSLFGPATSGQP